ncbi:unnamed protein product [Mytilus coruscus]|uniref:Hexosyltransferase n=1 Tax=Mytilus coruscus TaxID=42192 RepID=A0A6J8EAV6_MYTCO|nr:unnamed protein product [Mytilus coruscus]
MVLSNGWFTFSRRRVQLILLRLCMVLLSGFTIFQLKGLQSMLYIGKNNLFWNNTEHILDDVLEKGGSNVTPFNTFLINDAFLEDPKKVFEASDNIQLLLVVKSHLLNYGKRDAIRKTWGHVRKLRVKTVFVVGYLQNMTTVGYFESKLYKDIIILNVEDIYKNIVYKSIYSVICLSKLNITAEFVHLVDDDRLVNALNVYDVAKESIAQSDVAMLGYMFHSTKPFRRVTSKNFMSWEEYPFVYFPPYIIGGTILTNMKTIQVLAEAVKYVRIIQIEDVFIGIVAKAFRINMQHHSGFLPYKKPVNQLGNILSCPGYDIPYTLLRDWEILKKISK